MSSSVNMSKRIDGTVDENENFTETNGTKWHKELKPLGEGGYSQVYLYKIGGSNRAVKRIASISDDERTTSAELETEKAALIKFSKHELFVNFIEWFACENIEYFALEYVELRNLESNLEIREENRKKDLEKQGKAVTEDNRAEVCLPKAEVKKILTQILEGVAFMHAEKYIHRDLKPQVRHHHHLTAKHWVIYFSFRIFLSHKTGLSDRSKSQT